MPSTAWFVAALLSVVLCVATVILFVWWYLRNAWKKQVTFQDSWSFSTAVHRRDGATCRAIALKYGVTIDPGF